MNVDAVQLVGQVEGEGDSPQVQLGEVHGQRELGRAEAPISVNVGKFPVDIMIDQKVYKPFTSIPSHPSASHTVDQENFCC